MYTFDTNPIIYYIDDEPAAVAVLDDLFVQAVPLYTSTITELEMFSYPALTEEERKIEAFLRRVRIIPMFSNDDRLEHFERTVHTLAETADGEGSVEVMVTRNRSPIRPTIRDADLQQYIAHAAEHHAPGKWVCMPSAAGHDPMVLSDHLLCAMLFVPSINGISHDSAEDTSEADIILGCQVLADAAAAVLQSG